MSEEILLRANFGVPLKALTAGMHWKNILEFGTCRGESTLAFSLAGADVVTFDNLREDNWRDIYTTEAGKNASKTAQERFKKHGVYHKIDMIIADDKKLPLIDGLHWDCVFIDTSHQFEHTVLELEYSKNVTDNILLDDIGWSVKGKLTVMEAIEGFLKSNPKWFFTGRHDIYGVGWVFKKGE